ncbi:MAG: excalibur calcium-binding domain-containing protein [Acidimicrobiales bacterium]
MTALPLRVFAVALFVLGAACSDPATPTRHEVAPQTTGTSTSAATTSTTGAPVVDIPPPSTSVAPPVTTTEVLVEPTTSTPPEPVTPTTSVPVSSSAPSEPWPIILLGQLVVANPNPSLAYDRSDWGSGWSDDDGDCLSTRHEVLMLESADSVFLSDSGCLIAGGSWFGAFTGGWFTDPGDLDIDHFVPLAHAHQSGGWAWDAATKRRYYNDLTDPRHLIAVSASANRSKGARGPDEWRPPDTSYWCIYADTWADIKIRWALTVTANEILALEEMLATCSAEPVSIVETPAVIDLGPPIDLGDPIEPTPTTVPPSGDQPADPGNAMNCSDFANYQEALAWYETYAPWYGDVARLDGDGDGEPCESLPGGP